MDGDPDPGTLLAKLEEQHSHEQQRSSLKNNKWVCCLTWASLLS
jgi:hypothetical protein